MLLNLGWSQLGLPSQMNRHTLEWGSGGKRGGLCPAIAVGRSEVVGHFLPLEGHSVSPDAWDVRGFYQPLKSSEGPLSEGVLLALSVGGLARPINRAL